MSINYQDLIYFWIFKDFIAEWPLRKYLVMISTSSWWSKFQLKKSSLFTTDMKVSPLRNKLPAYNKSVTAENLTECYIIKRWLWEVYWKKLSGGICHMWISVVRILWHSKIYNDPYRWINIDLNSNPSQIILYNNSLIQKSP